MGIAIGGGKFGKGEQENKGLVFSISLSNRAWKESRDVSRGTVEAQVTNKMLK